MKRIFLNPEILGQSAATLLLYGVTEFFVLQKDLEQLMLFICLIMMVIILFKIVSVLLETEGLKKRHETPLNLMQTPEFTKGE